MGSSNGNSRARLDFATWLLVAALPLLASGCGRPPPVDPALVGTWNIPVPGGRWAFSIDASGRYAFVNQAGGAAPSHNGELTAHDGEWTLHSTSMALEDHGRYELANGSLKLTGNRGAIQWARGETPPPTVTSTTTAASTAAPTLPAASTPPTPSASAAPKTTSAATPPPAAAQPVAARTGVLPDTIDPCLLVTPEEASQLLGAAVQPERTTPQPHQQNDCLYRIVRAMRSVQVTTFNGNGLDTSAWLGRLRSMGGTPYEGLGDGAVFKYNTALGVTDVGFVIGTASFSVTIGGMPREQAEPAARAFAANMAKRVMSGAGTAATPGLERFVGTWMANLPRDVRVVWWIERDGRVRIQGSGGFEGEMVLNGANWQIDVPFDKPATGTYSVTGDRLKIGGPSLVTDLTRVPCGKSPQAQLPFDFTLLIAARLNGKLNAINPKADGKGFDARLAGLWEGEGTVQQRHVVVLASIDDRGRSLFALFPTTTGKFEASGGQFKLSLDGQEPATGTYQFQGGVAEGRVDMADKDESFWMSPYDPNRNPPYAEKIVGHCR
jgi:hypothetical protein